MSATVTHPCGHTASLDASFNGKDRWRCPECGGEFEVYDVERPRKLDSGFIMPGKRAIWITRKGRN